MAKSLYESVSKAGITMPFFGAIYARLGQTSVVLIGRVKGHKTLGVEYCGTGRPWQKELAALGKHRVLDMRIHIARLCTKTCVGGVSDADLALQIATRSGQQRPIAVSDRSFTSFCAKLILLRSMNPVN